MPQRSAFRLSPNLPDWVRLRDEATIYYGHRPSYGQIIAFARHTYSNYDKVLSAKKDVSGKKRQTYENFKEFVTTEIMCYYKEQSRAWQEQYSREHPDEVVSIPIGW